MSKSYTFILLFIAVVFELLTWYVTPTMTEDLLYRFVWQQYFDGPREPISSLGDVLRSQQIHYMYGYCGRFVVHCVAQTLMNLVPDELTKVLSTLMFVLMIVLVTKTVNAAKELRAVTTALAFTMIFVLMQGFRMGFMWTEGIYNYLWVMVANLAFILMLRAFQRTGANPNYLVGVLAVTLALIAGATHEGLSIPISIALLYWLFSHRNTINTCCVLAYIIGLVTILVAPSLWHRVDENVITLPQRLLAGVINLVLNVRISWLLVITLAMQLHKGKAVVMESLRTNRYYLTAWAAAMGIVLTCGETQERVAIHAEFLAMLALLRIWQGEWLRRYKTATLCIAMMICTIVAVPAIALNRQNHENYLYHCSQLEEPDARIIKIGRPPMARVWQTNG